MGAFPGPRRAGTDAPAAMSPPRHFLQPVHKEETFPAPAHRQQPTSCCHRGVLQNHVIRTHQMIHSSRAVLVCLYMSIVWSSLQNHTHLHTWHTTTSQMSLSSRTALSELHGYMCQLQRCMCELHAWPVCRHLSSRLLIHQVRGTTLKWWNISIPASCAQAWLIALGHACTGVLADKGGPGGALRQRARPALPPWGPCRPLAAFWSHCGVQLLHSQPASPARLLSARYRSFSKDMGCLQGLSITVHMGGVEGLPMADLSMYTTCVVLALVGACTAMMVACTACCRLCTQGIEFTRSFTSLLGRGFSASMVLAPAAMAKAHIVTSSMLPPLDHTAAVCLRQTTHASQCHAHAGSAWTRITASA